MLTSPAGCLPHVTSQAAWNLGNLNGFTSHKVLGVIGWVTDEGVGDTRGKLGEYPQNLQLKIEVEDRTQVQGAMY